MIEALTENELDMKKQTPISLYEIEYRDAKAAVRALKVELQEAINSKSESTNDKLRELRENYGKAIAHWKQLKSMKKSRQPPRRENLPSRDGPERKDADTLRESPVSGETPIPQKLLFHQSKDLSHETTPNHVMTKDDIVKVEQDETQLREKLKRQDIGQAQIDGENRSALLLKHARHLNLELETWPSAPVLYDMEKHGSRTAHETREKKLTEARSLVELSMLAPLPLGWNVVLESPTKQPSKIDKNVADKQMSPNWKAKKKIRVQESGYHYRNEFTGETLSEHPLDAYFRDKIRTVLGLPTFQALKQPSMSTVAILECASKPRCIGVFFRQEELRQAIKTSQVVGIKFRNAQGACLFFSNGRWRLNDHDDTNGWFFIADEAASRRSPINPPLASTAWRACSPATGVPHFLGGEHSHNHSSRLGAMPPKSPLVKDSLSAIPSLAAPTSFSAVTKALLRESTDPLAAEPVKGLRKRISFISSRSLGMKVVDDCRVQAVYAGGQAYEQGVRPPMKILSVAGVAVETFADVKREMDRQRRQGHQLVSFEILEVPQTKRADSLGRRHTPKLVDKDIGSEVSDGAQISTSKKKGLFLSKKKKRRRKQRTGGIFLYMLGFSRKPSAKIGPVDYEEDDRIQQMIADIQRCRAVTTDDDDGVIYEEPSDHVVSPSWIK